MTPALADLLLTVGFVAAAMAVWPVLHADMRRSVERLPCRASPHPRVHP